MNIKFEKEEVEIMRIIFEFFLKKEISYEQARTFWALWNAGHNDPIISTYITCKELFGKKTI